MANKSRTEQRNEKKVKGAFARNKAKVPTAYQAERDALKKQKRRRIK